jgi:hypothetical protein
MKNVTCVIVIFSLFLFFTGCANDGRIPIQQGLTRTDLSKNNFRVLKANVRGDDSGFKLFGFIPIVSPSYADAMRSLHHNVDMEGKSTALANVAQDRSTLYLILFSIPKITVTADIIEFTGE